MRYVPPDNLRRRIEVHRLKAEGLTNNGIKVRLGCSKDFVASALGKPCPTEEEIREAETRYACGPRTAGGLVRIDCYVTSNLHDRLMAEVEKQGSSRSAVLALACEFYVSYMERHRAGGAWEIPLKAFRRGEAT